MTPVVLVTGASRGLGRGIAVELAEGGYSVAINYAGNRAAAEECAELCKAAAPSADQKFLPVQGEATSAGVAADRLQSRVHDGRIFDLCKRSVTQLNTYHNNAVQKYGIEATDLLTENFTRLVHQM